MNHPSQQNVLFFSQIWYLIRLSSSGIEDESSSFQYVMCIYCGVCVFKTMEEVPLFNNGVLHNLIYYYMLCK